MKRDAQHYVYLVQSEVAFSVNERFEKPADFATEAYNFVRDRTKTQRRQ